MNKHMLRSTLGVVSLLSGLVAAQAAQKTYTTKDASGTGTLTFCAFDAGSFGIASCHIPITSGGVELFTTTAPGYVKTFDTLIASSAVSAADAASTTTTGQSGVSIVTGTATANSTYSQAVNSQSEVALTITGTFVGTLQIEGSANGGTTWTPRSAHVMGTKYRVSQVTAPGAVHIDASGLTNIRVRAIALTSGSATIQANTTPGTGSIYVMNPVELADNATGLSPAVKAGGTAALSDNGLTVQDPTVAKAIGDTAVPGPASPNYRLPSAAASTNATFFSGSAGKKVLGGYACNAATSFRSVKFYDKASAPTVGTDAPVMTIPMLPGCGAIDVPPGGLLFTNGVAIAITAGAADTDTTAVSAGDLLGLNIFHN